MISSRIFPILGCLCVSTLFIPTSVYAATTSTINIKVSIGSGYYDEPYIGNYIETDTLELYEQTEYVIGETTTIPALGTQWKDLKVTSSLETLGTHRTITLRMESIDGGALLDQAAVNLLAPNTKYSLSFKYNGYKDPLVLAPVHYASMLLDANGEYHKHTTWNPGPFFMGGSSYVADDSPAGPNFLSEAFGSIGAGTPSGLEVVMEYNIIPEPTSLMLLSLTGLLIRRR